MTPLIVRPSFHGRLLTLTLSLSIAATFAAAAATPAPAPSSKPPAAKVSPSSPDTPESSSSRISIATIRFSPDGARVLCSITRNGQEWLQLWDTTTGKPVGGPIRDARWKEKQLFVRWNLDGSRFVTFTNEANKSTMVQLWDATTGIAVGSPIPNQPDDLNETSFPMFSAASGYLATNVRGKVTKWDAVTGRRLAQTRDKEHIERVVSQSVGSDSPSIPGGTFMGVPITVSPGLIRTAQYSQENPGTVEIRDGVTGAKVATIGPGIEYCRGFAQNKRVLLSVISKKKQPDGTTLSTYQMWDLVTGKRLGKPMITSGILLLAQDGKRLIESGLPAQKRCCVLWSLDETRPLARLTAENLRYGEYEFSPRGKYIATAVGAELMVWNASTGKKVFSAKATDKAAPAGATKTATATSEAPKAKTKSKAGQVAQK